AAKPAWPHAIPVHARRISRSAVAEWRSCHSERKSGIPVLRRPLNRASIPPCKKNGGLKARRRSCCYPALLGGIGCRNKVAAPQDIVGRRIGIGLLLRRIDDGVLVRQIGDARTQPQSLQCVSEAVTEREIQVID